MRIKQFRKTFFRPKYLGVLMLPIFLIAIFFFYQNQAYTLHFVDEEDNLVLGSYLLKGEKLYSDLFSHHQPLAYIFSAFIQKITHPSSLYFLIKSHRLIIIIYSFIWSLFLYFNFGLPVLIFIFIFEPIKGLLLGNHFLSESLVVYPLIYLITLTFSNKKHPKIQELVIGFLAGIIALTLAPVWPLLAFIIIILLLKSASPYRTIKNYFLGCLPIIAFAAYFLSLKDYFLDVFYVNLNYFIPHTSNAPAYITITKAFFTPLISLLNFSPNNTSLIIIQLLTIALIINLLIFLRHKKYRETISTITILGLANIRYVQPGQHYYQGFHFLPWFAIFVYLVSQITITNLQTIKKINVSKIILVCTLLVATIISLNHLKNGLINKKDPAQEFHIRYSQQLDLGQAISIMSANNQNETLFVTDEWLLYWQSGLPHASSMLHYYDWMPQIPTIRSKVEQMFGTSPPTYIHINNPKALNLEDQLTNYQQLKKHGQNSSLYVLSDKINSLTPAQISALNQSGFTVK